METIPKEQEPAGMEARKDRTERAGRAARVLIVDDHPIVRRGWAELIEAEGDLDIAGEAADAAAALEAMQSGACDLVVIDITLKGMNGIELAKAIRARDPNVKMLMVSMLDDELYADRALRAGALGYVNKSEGPEKLIEAMRKVLAGQVYLSPSASDRALERMVGPARQPRSPADSLSDRELEVFAWIGRGLTTQEIARRLNRSPKTIETHRENIKSKLNIRNAARLTVSAVEWVRECERGVHEQPANPTAEGEQPSA